MTPEQFADTLVPPEKYRRVAIVAALPLYAVSQWMSAVQRVLLQRGMFDSFVFRINPMRLWAIIDGWDEPRLTITFVDPMDRRLPAPSSESDPGLIIIENLTL